jgi:hypothetical protein
VLTAPGVDAPLTRVLGWMRVLVDRALAERAEGAEWADRVPAWLERLRS